MGRMAIKDQLGFWLFIEPEKPKGSPTWDDVQKKRAHVQYRYEPCDRCEGDWYSFWDGDRCTHVKGRFGYPKLQDDGTCRRAYHVWGQSPHATLLLDNLELYVCACGGFPSFVGGVDGVSVQCSQCGRKTAYTANKRLAAALWNETR